ncbi:1,2-phenylacetyl-CoA epoxidase subunit PaaC [Sediminibacterium sp.]|uniref:1,2-phenylacetyl-CoA epoxidase subunit PaaC n=1 Tax=Sediminibacterium sp. TaxID=1917865 RepID=UPI003F6FF9EE
MKNEIDFLLHLADNALIIGHRNSEWCGHGPILEQDIAITNIALDYIGQARNFYQHAAELINRHPIGIDITQTGNDIVLPATEDSLAYLRDVREFKNLLITEIPNGDWAHTTLRLFLLSEFEMQLFTQLLQHPDTQVAAIAEKSIKEVSYHVKWSQDWVLRLGDGTEESKQRMQAAIEAIWAYTGELFIQPEYATAACLNYAAIQDVWNKKVSAVFEEAGLNIPSKTFVQKGGAEGMHTEHLGYILAEMQYLQRAYPNSEW